MPLSQDAKKKARRAVATARRAGRLPTPMVCECWGCAMHDGPCENGAWNGHRLEAHHPDHQYPLVVIQLCNRCHKVADERTQMTKAVIEQAQRLRAQGLSLSYIAKQLGVSIRTLRKHVDRTARIHIDLIGGHDATGTQSEQGQGRRETLAPGSDGQADSPRIEV